MPRNMSFALTTDQVKASAKCVTRRLGWGFLESGDLVNACVKTMGLRKGEKVKKLALIRVLSTRRELLNAVDQLDCCLEGFPHLTPAQFVDMLCTHYKGRVTPNTEVNRIEFCYEQTYTQVEWRCPFCGCLNLDDYLVGPFTRCTGAKDNLGCGRGLYWSEIEPYRRLFPRERLPSLRRVVKADQRLAQLLMDLGAVGERAWVEINAHRGPLFREAK